MYVLRCHIEAPASLLKIHSLGFRLSWIQLIGLEARTGRRISPAISMRGNSYENYSGSPELLAANISKILQLEGNGSENATTYVYFRNSSQLEGPNDKRDSAEHLECWSDKDKASAG